MQAAAASPYYRGASERRLYQGVDFMSGEMNPGVGKGRSGMIVAEESVGS